MLMEMSDLPVHQQIKLAVHERCPEGLPPPRTPSVSDSDSSSDSSIAVPDAESRQQNPE